MLTVREALTMPTLARASVVAGHGGLDREITGVHIIDIPEAHYEWGRAGVLLLTTCFGLKDAPDRQAALIPKLVELEFACVVFSVGYYLKETPDVIRQAADELNFPVIETPWDLMFIDITETIYEKIVSRQYAVLQKSNHIHELLTNLVLRGGDLNDLAERLARLLKRSITIEDPACCVLASGQYGAVDKARERSIQLGRASSQVAQRLMETGIYDKLLHKMGPVHVPPIPELDMPMERIVAPIIVDREIHGYIWIISGGRPLTKLDELAIRHGATVAALIMFKEQAVREAEEALRGDFFEQLLKGAPHTALLTEQARQLGYRLNQPHQVLLVRGKPAAGGSSRPLGTVVDNWLRSQAHRALIVWRNEGLMLVIESHKVSAGKELAESMIAALSHPTRRLLIGIGSVFKSVNGESTGIQRSYDEAREAAAVGAALGQQEGIVIFEELGILHWLYQLSPEQQMQNSYIKHIDTLADYDAARKTELVKTLETYLDHGGSLVETAEALFLHRNSLLHRVNRIEQLCQVNLRDPHHRLNLHAAVKSYLLHKGD